MASGMSILGGLLGGIGGFGQQVGGAMSEQRREELRREQLAIEQQRADQQMEMQRNTLDQSQRQFDATMASHAADRAPIDLPPDMGGGSVIAKLLPFLLEQRKEQALIATEERKAGRERDMRIGQAGELERIGAGRPASEAVLPPDEGAMYSAGEPATPAVAANPRLQLYAALLRQGPLGEHLAKALEAGSAPKYGHAPPNSMLLGPQNENMGMVPGAEPKNTSDTVTTEQGVFRVTFGPGGQETGRVRIGDRPAPAPHAPREPREPVQPNAMTQVTGLASELQRRIDAGETQQNSAAVRSLVAQLNVAKIVAGAPGGKVYGAGDLVGTTPGQDPRTLASTPATPPGNILSDVSDLDTQIAAFSNLAARAKSPAVAGALGLGAAPRRFMEDTLKMNTLTDEQRRFRGEVAIELTSAKKSKIGVNQTMLERSGLLPALPSDSDPGMAAKLEAWVAAAQRNRDAINRVLGSVGQKVPNASGEPAARPGSVIRYYDAQGNRIP